MNEWIAIRVIWHHRQVSRRLRTSYPEDLKRGMLNLKGPIGVQMQLRWQKSPRVSVNKQ